MFNYIILIFAIGGLVLVLVANVVLLFGRRPGITIWQIISSGHLSPQQRRDNFRTKYVTASGVLGYTGLLLFLLAIILMVGGAIRDYN